VRVLITEYLRIDLDAERWECRRCDHSIGAARENYKHGLLVYDRDPSEIHKPLLDPKRYAFTFAPDPSWCRILEYYCPGCGTLVEAEYTVPGHPPAHDIDLDIDALKTQWRARTELLAPASAPEGHTPARDHRHSHGHRPEVHGS
jgi:acetone carboxylase gamma subunit